MAKRGNWANQVPWPPEKDAGLLDAILGGQSWAEAGRRAGVTPGVAMRRWEHLYPSVPRPNKKGEPRANAAPLVFVSAAAYRNHTLHAPDMSPESARSVERSTQRDVSDARC